MYKTTLKISEIIYNIVHNNFKTEEKVKFIKNCKKSV